MTNTEAYRFKVGSFECTAVSDGTFVYAPPLVPPPATFLFVNAPKESLEPALRQHNVTPEHWSQWVSPYICLVVKTGEHLVLVDTGADGFSPTTGKLLQNLRDVGIAPEEIDMVIITHAHPDHIGGNIDDQGKLSFPNARYAMWKGEWDFWTSPEAQERVAKQGGERIVGFARKNLPPIKDRLILIEHETEIVPGIQALAAPGHTPGHIALSISSNDKKLLCLGDVVLHPIHLERPEWCAVTDFVPQQLVATRGRLLRMAATNKALVHAFHFPFPGLGYVIPRGEAWQWQTGEMTA
jgi:glyoxylase-like metal-dependent hydrolase (beta-lactamase superfamily II)